jgi:hypothetical protein
MKMALNIDNFSAKSGRLVKEDGATVNVGDLLENSTLNKLPYEHTFQNAATTTGNGTAFVVGSYKTITVEIYGTSASRTVTFYGKSKSGTLRAIQGVRISDFTLATSTTTTGEIWQFDITGLDYVVMDLTAVAGGNVSVKGTAVA